jgi:hypothetical protein
MREITEAEMMALAQSIKPGGVNAAAEKTSKSTGGVFAAPIASFRATGPQGISVREWNAMSAAYTKPGGFPEPLTSRKSATKPCCDDCGEAEALGKPKPCAQNAARPVISQGIAGGGFSARPNPFGATKWGQLADRLRTEGPRIRDPYAHARPAWTRLYPEPEVVCSDPTAHRHWLEFSPDQVAFFRRILFWSARLSHSCAPPPLQP